MLGTRECRKCRPRARSMATLWPHTCQPKTALDTTGRPSACHRSPPDMYSVTSITRPVPVTHTPCSQSRPGSQQQTRALLAELARAWMA